MCRCWGRRVFWDLRTGGRWTCSTRRRTERAARRSTRRGSTATGSRTRQNSRTSLTSWKVTNPNPRDINKHWVDKKLLLSSLLKMTKDLSHFSSRGFFNEKLESENSFFGNIDLVCFFFRFSGCGCDGWGDSDGECDCSGVPGVSAERCRHQPEGVLTETRLTHRLASSLASQYRVQN